MDSNGYPQRISTMDIHGCPWISIHIHGCPDISMDNDNDNELNGRMSSESEMITTDQWISRVSHGYLKIIHRDIKPDNIVLKLISLNFTSMEEF